MGQTFLHRGIISLREQWQLTSITYTSLLTVLTNKKGTGSPSDAIHTTSTKLTEKRNQS